MKIKTGVTLFLAITILGGVFHAVFIDPQFKNARNDKEEKIDI